jgi:hypothetical protein
METHVNATSAIIQIAKTVLSSLASQRSLLHLHSNESLLADLLGYLPSGASLITNNDGRDMEPVSSSDLDYSSTRVSGGADEYW